MGGFYSGESDGIRLRYVHGSAYPKFKGGAAKAEVTRTQQLISMLCNVFFFGLLY